MLHQLGYRKLIKLCFLSYICVLVPPSWGKRSNEEIVFAALKQTEKVCIRKEKFIRQQSEFYGKKGINESEKIKNIATKLLKKLKKEGISVEETKGGIEKWVRDLEKNNAMIKKRDSELSLEESLEIRLFVTILKEQIEEQKALDKTPPLWGTKFEQKGSESTLIDYLFPYTKFRLGRLDEEHPRLNESAADEIVARLQDEKLFLEISQNTIEHYVETKDYKQDGRNTRHIFTKHYNNKNADHTNIKPSDYRYTTKFLTKKYRIGLTKWMMIHLLYYPEACQDFYKLKIGDLLSLHEEEKKVFQELAKNPKQFPKNDEFEGMYLEIRKVLVRRLKYRLAQTCVIDDLLENYKNERIKEVIGVNTSLRQRDRTFANCLLELKLYDELMDELIHGNVNSKVGSEHGFWHHKAIMDSFQSDEAFLESISKRWAVDFRTHVQRRYGIDRLQKLLDQGQIGGVKVQLGDLGEFSILDIISSSVLEYDTMFLAEVNPKIDRKRIAMIEYSHIVNIYLEKPTKSSSLAILALGAGAAAIAGSSKIIWNNEKPPRKKRKRRVKEEINQSDEASEEDTTGSSVKS